MLAKFTEQAANREANGEKAEQERSPIIALMEEKVLEYNHIISHKHLNKDFHEETRRILKIGKDEEEELLEKLQDGVKKLENANLITQIHINKYMAQLYKSYRHKLDRSPTPKSPEKTKTMISEPAKSGHNVTKHEEIPKIERRNHLFRKENSERKAANSRSDRALLINIQTVEHSLRMTEGRVNSHHCSSNHPYLYQDEAKAGCVTDRTSNRRDGSSQQKNRLLKTIYSPFLEKEKLEQYRLIEKGNNNNMATLDLFRTKINDFRSKSITHYKEKQGKSKKITTVQHSLDEQMPN